MTTIVLDNEAVQALVDARHAKHRRVLAHLEGIVVRRKRGHPGRAAVPTAVRVEAGWDRSRAAAAAINRFHVTDAGLDGPTANVAAAIRARESVGVADAHLGAVVANLAEAASDRVVILTSDPDDTARASAPVPVTIVRI